MTIRMGGIFGFRFDIDSEKCLRDGVPNIIRIGRKTGARFTFFASMGRAVSIPHMFMNSRTREGAGPDVKRLSALQKLGPLDFFKTAVFNPLIGARYAGILREAWEAGHEIALHGGKNHGSWAAAMPGWDRARIENEIDWAMDRLARAGIDGGITGFASPCWRDSPALYEVLRARGFKYTSNVASESEDAVSLLHNLVSVPVNICGQPGKVAYIEHKRAQDMDDPEVLADFEMNLEKHAALAVAFEHPYYAGTRESGLLEKLLQKVADSGRRAVTLREIASGSG